MRFVTISCMVVTPLMQMRSSFIHNMSTRLGCDMMFWKV